MVGKGRNFAKNLRNYKSIETEEGYNLSIDKEAQSAYDLINKVIHTPSQQSNPKDPYNRDQPKTVRAHYFKSYLVFVSLWSRRNHRRLIVLKEKR